MSHFLLTFLLFARVALLHVGISLVSVEWGYWDQVPIGTMHLKDLHPYTLVVLQFKLYGADVHYTWLGN